MPIFVRIRSSNFIDFLNCYYYYKCVDWLIGGRIFIFIYCHVYVIFIELRVCYHSCLFIYFFHFFN